MCTLLDIAKEEINNKIKNGETLTAWRQASEVLGWVKKIEMALRKELVEKNFAESKKGKNTVELEEGTLSFTKTYKTEVDETLFNEVAKECEKAFINVGSLFNVKHSLVASEYKQYSDAEKAIIDKMLVVKEQAPKLEFSAKAED